jgi:signal recognition particle subunit SRP72
MATAILGAFQRTHLDDHDEILKHSNETLKTSKNDTTALHQKAVALLNLNRFEDAVKVFEQADSSLKDTAPLEHAYALYKSGDFEQARKVAHGVDNRGARHLEAQAV